VPHAVRIVPYDPAWPVKTTRLADQLKTVREARRPAVAKD
jgi:GrpB-like predicted nucleotidyltransferase (UPF0157 family)